MKQSSLLSKHSKLFHSALAAISKGQMSNLTISRLQMMFPIGWLGGEKLMKELVEAGVVTAYPNPTGSPPELNLGRAQSLLYSKEEA